jgi:guanine nucleotide-binding protein subunit beta-2-like 1 protein
MTPLFSLEIVVKGHTDGITSLSVSEDNPNIIVSGSRDKSIIVWDFNRSEDIFITPRKRLKGHSHFVSDLKLSSDGQFCVSSSWDNSLKLWDVNSGKVIQSFLGHQKGVLSVCFSKDERQIISGSRDGSIKLWNTLGKCKKTYKENTKNYWIIFVRFLAIESPLFVSCSWDGAIDIWDISLNRVKNRLKGHKGYVQSIAISPDSSLCASGGQDENIMLWDLQEGKHLYSLFAGEKIHSICFSPNRYWLCASTNNNILIWNLESKEIINKIETKNIHNETENNGSFCMSMIWNADGSGLFTGHKNGHIKFWKLNS